MKWRAAGSVALLIVSLANFAGGQQDPDPLYKLDPQSRRQIQTLIDSARQADLPWNSLRLKAIEGANKKVDGKKVLAAVRDLYRTLSQSRSILGPLASSEVIVTGAEALTAKVSPATLAEFRVTATGRSPMRALVYLTDLVDKHNVPRDDAVAAFARLWKDGASDSDFDGLWRGIDQDILSGVSPKDALQNRMRSFVPPRLSKPPELDEDNPHS